MLGLEPRPADDDLVRRARALTAALRLRARAPDARFEVEPRGDQDLTELEQLASCRDDAPSCIADIGAYLEVDYLIYGHLERRGAVVALRLYLMDVAERINRRTVELAVDGAGAPADDAWARLGAGR